MNEYEELCEKLLTDLFMLEQMEAEDACYFDFANELMNKLKGMMPIENVRSCRIAAAKIINDMCEEE